VKDSTGNTIDRIRYSAWGVATMDHGSDDIQSFTGKDYDASGLIYFNARYYDSTTGRFLTEDPSRKGVNWYAYCENDPINKTDATGLDAGAAGRDPSQTSSPFVTVDPRRAAVVATLRGAPNQAGAVRGTAVAFPEAAVQNVMGHSFVDTRDPAGVTVPVVSGGYNNAPPNPGGTRHDVPTLSVASSPTAAKNPVGPWECDVHAAWHNSGCRCGQCNTHGKQFIEFQRLPVPKVVSASPVGLAPEKMHRRTTAD